MKFIINVIVLIFFCFPIPGRTRNISIDSLAQSGGDLRVERIEISGTRKTRPFVVLRRLTFTAGDPIDAAIIEENYNRLQETNFFSKIAFYTRPGTERGQVIVEINLKERRWPTFHVEGGTNEFDGWYISPLAIRYDNLFGHGYHLSLNSQIGDHFSGINLTFLAPYFFDSDYWTRAEIFARSHNYLHTFPGETWRHEVGMGGFRLDFGGQSGLFRFLSFRLQSKGVDPKNTATVARTNASVQEFPAVIARDTVSARINSFFVILANDSRNSREYPTRGIWASASWESGKETLNDSFMYHKFIFDGRWFFNPVKKHVFALRLKYGETGTETPFYERFYSGGPLTLRGYPDRGLTPIGWGTRMALMNLEYRVPLSHTDFPRHRLTGALFFDAGGIWLPGESVDYRHLFYAGGCGIRVRLPFLGLVRLDVAFPFTKKDLLFHLSLGHMF